MQGYQKILNNPQLRGLKNTPHKLGTINLKLENWINASLHIGTLLKISFKNLTLGLCIFNYGNYKFYTEYKTYAIFKINLEKQTPELLFTKRCSCRFCKFNRKTSVLESPWRSPWSLFWKRLQASSLKACNFMKKWFQQMFSCEISEIFKRAWF